VLLRGVAAGGVWQLAVCDSGTVAAGSVWQWYGGSVTVARWQCGSLHDGSWQWRLELLAAGSWRGQGDSKKKKNDMERHSF
jgi:hypothetical protein